MAGTSSAVVILSAQFTPDRTTVGTPVLISVSVVEVGVVPSTPVYLSGEFQSGEV